jgi:hypothetical protein
MWRRWVLGGLLLALTAGVVGWRLTLRPPAEAGPRASAAVSALPPPTAGPAERALVAPLAPGDDLGGFAVRALQGVERGRMRVVLTKGDAEVRLDVALADPDARMPPAATAGRYAVFYSLHGASPEDGERLAQKLGALIGAHADVPAPPGMTVFTPAPKPGTPL